MIQKKRNILLTLFAFVVVANSFAQESEKSTLKVMTYNIWNGFDWGKDTLRKKNFIEWMENQQPDVVALQELCGYNEQQLKKDARQWGHEYVQLLKTKGYPTALTSNKPIHLKERDVDNFWHGMLHCKSYGIDFFVVHLSPSDCDIRLKEAKQITKRVQELENDSYIILGDFNALSPMDAFRMVHNSALKAKYAQGDDEKYSNLRLGEFDYSVISAFLAAPAVDVCLGKTDLQEGFTFPTPALIGMYNNTARTIGENRQRIDYILASPKLARSCVKVDVFNQEETHLLSDHYPVMSEFYISQ